MRKTKELFSGDKKILIQEMTPREILSLFNSWKNDVAIQEKEKLLTWSEIPEKFIPALLNISYDRFLDYTGSEIEQIIISFKEVNASFFKIPDLLAFLKIKDLAEGFLNQMKAGMLVNAQNNLSASYPELPGITTENKPSMPSKPEITNATINLSAK